MLVKVPKRLDHRPRFLGGGRAIKIDQRMAVGLFTQNREIFAKGLPIDNAASNLVHAIICSMGHHAPPLFKKLDRIGGAKTITSKRRLGMRARVEHVVLNALAKISALRPTLAPLAITDGIVFGEADPPFADATVYRYFNSSFASAKAFTANSKSSRECAADTCVRMRAVPCGTTG